MKKILLPIILITSSIFATSSSTSHIYWNINDIFISLEQAPLLSNNITSSNKLSIPTPNGYMKEFYIYQSPVMPVLLSEKFPNIKTYTGVGIDNPSDRASIAINGSSIRAMILSNKGNIFISNLDEENLFRVSFDELDSDSEYNEFNCGNTLINEGSSTRTEFDECIGENEPCYTMGNELITYRVAMIMTESVTNSVADGTVEGGMTWVASMTNQLNLLWRRELGFEFTLIPNQDILIFTNENPAPGGDDGFSYTWETCQLNDGDPKYCELNNVEPYLESVIGIGGLNAPNDSRLWEYGLVLNTIYNGGVAQAPGPMSANNPTYEVLNHELGHNLGSAHNITIEGGYRCTLGGTIMGSRTRTSGGGYGDQYSLHTIEIGFKNYNTLLNDPAYADAYAYLGGYSSIESNNVIPEINVPNSGFSIPKETPFVLEGSSSPSNPNYLYSWEQNDASSTSFCMDLTGASGECDGLPEWPATEGPLFSTVDLSPNGNMRYFPIMSSLLNNEYSTIADDYGTLLTVERLPFGTRDINMRLQVRSNEATGGSVNFKNLSFSVDGSSGPFRVTSQDSAVSWDSESSQTINWDVANTDLAPINCSNVDILFSTDAGRNFDTVLADNVPNNGSYEIMVPQMVNADSCRIMVKASENIFFDINSAYIAVTNSNIPDISLNQNEINLQVAFDSQYESELVLTNSGEVGSVLSYAISFIDSTYINEGFEGLSLDNSVDSEEYILPTDWSRSSNGRGWIIGTEETSAWADWLLDQLSDMYFDIPNWSGGNYAFTDDEQYNICPSCVQYADCYSNNGCTDGSMDFLLTPTISIPSHSLANLSFDHWFQFAIGNQHQNTLQIFNNDTWVDIETLNQTGAQFTHNSYDLNAYSGSEIKLRFHSESDESGEGLGGGWAIDNILLESSPNWLSSSDMDGDLINGESISIPLNIDAQGLNVGETYTTKIFVTDTVNNISEELSLSIEIADSTYQLGDTNFDDIVDILDIILGISIILGNTESTDEQLNILDMNQDGNVDVIDIVEMINYILAD